MEPHIEGLEPRRVLGIRTQVKVEQIGDTIGRLVPDLMAVAGPHVAGPLLSRWHDWEDDGGTMEVAVPVGAGAEGSGDVVASELPGGRAVVLDYVGPYEGLRDTWTRLRAWLEAEGHEGRAAPWEDYVSDPATTPADDLLTRIVWPIA